MNAAALRLGTRGSPLALWQARTVAARLEAHGIAVEIVPIRTGGDRLAHQPLSEIGGKGVFVKEIEDALLAGTIDIAVHSAKDLAAILPAGLVVAATLPREDPRDVLVLPSGSPAVATLDDAIERLGPAPRIGTGSVRRARQLTARLPHAIFTAVRGNVETRLAKLDAGGHDALVLAAAGLRRLGLAQRISLNIPVEISVPAPGQGIVAVEVREDDRHARASAALVHDAAAGAAFEAERAVVAALGGGCQLPLGAIARPDGDTLDLIAVVIPPESGPAVRVSERGPIEAPAALGRAAAEALLRGGAGEILDLVRTER